MTAKEATSEIWNRYRTEPWFQGVGIGADEAGNTILYIYTRKKKYPQPLDKFADFPVFYQYVGKLNLN